MDMNDFTVIELHNNFDITSRLFPTMWLFSDEPMQPFLSLETPNAVRSVA